MRDSGDGGAVAPGTLLMPPNLPAGRAGQRSGSFPGHGTLLRRASAGETAGRREAKLELSNRPESVARMQRLTPAGAGVTGSPKQRIS